MSELKPCPFCGNKNIEIIHDYHPICSDCGASQDNVCGCDAVQEWNTRATDDQLTTTTKQRDELNDIITEFLDEPAVRRSLSDEMLDKISDLLSTIKEQKDAE